MADEKTEFWIFGALISAITGIYYFFLRHIFNHVGSAEIARLKKDVQYKENCEQIVKRQDENHEEVCKKLDRILDKLDRKE